MSQQFRKLYLNDTGDEADVTLSGSEFHCSITEGKMNT